MKFEYLADGSQDCPLIRLYAFNRAEARLLTHLVSTLVTGECQRVALQGEAWAEPVGGCSLTLGRGARNQGVYEVDPLKFECVLSSHGWSNVEGLLEPFCDSDPAGFQWLTSDGSVSLLISQSGQCKTQGPCPVCGLQVVWRPAQLK
jgi:hypothetical protein